MATQKNVLHVQKTNIDVASFFELLESKSRKNDFAAEESETIGHEGYIIGDDPQMEYEELNLNDEDYKFLYDSASLAESLIRSDNLPDISDHSPKSHFKDASTVKKQISNRWLEIIRDLAPDLEEAIFKKGKHVPCPMHGGRDGFRLFNDADTTGGGVCNTCGFFSDGFSLLQAINCWSFPETLRRVAQWLDENADDEGEP